VPLAIGRSSHVANAILNKNVGIVCNVQVIHKDHVQEADHTIIEGRSTRELASWSDATSAGRLIQCRNSA
jgi:hypothetical protein